MFFVFIKNRKYKNTPNVIVDRVIKSLIFVIKLIIIPKKPININPKINSKILKSLTRWIFKLDKFKKSLPKPAILINVRKRMSKNKIKVINNY